MSKENFFAGIDIGSRTCKGVIINDNREVVASDLRKTGLDSKNIAEISFKKMIESSAVKKDKVKYVVSTGYGRANADFAQKEITEISCHGYGAFNLFSDIRGIIDIGGQDSKVIRLNDTGKVIDFSMNDKCAAGTGKFMETMAVTLNLTIDEISKIGLNAEKAVDISNVCTVFAESEVINYIHKGESKKSIIAGLYKSVADKVMKQVNKVNPSPQIVMSGGVAKNEGVVQMLEKQLESNLKIPESPQLVGAFGAALLAFKNYNNN